MAHTEIGRRLLDRLIADLAEHGQVEQHASMEGRQITMVITQRKR
jgi:translation initiation factor IF-3